MLASVFRTSQAIGRNLKIFNLCRAISSGMKNNVTANPPIFEKISSPKDIARDPEEIVNHATNSIWADLPLGAHSGKYFLYHLK